MKKLIKKFLKKGLAFALIFLLPGFFSLCCSSSCMASMSSVSMSSKANCLGVPQNEEMKTQVQMSDVRDCPKCECKNVAATLGENSSKKFNLKDISLKSDYKFLTAILSDSLSSSSPLAFSCESPPISLWKSVPIYLFNRVLRL